MVRRGRGERPIGAPVQLACFGCVAAIWLAQRSVFLQESNLRLSGGERGGAKGEGEKLLRHTDLNFQNWLFWTCPRFQVRLFYKLYIYFKNDYLFLLILSLKEPTCFTVSTAPWRKQEEEGEANKTISVFKVSTDGKKKLKFISSSGSQRTNSGFVSNCVVK